MTPAGGLLAAYAASRLLLLRRGEGVLHRIASARRALTADAAEALQEDRHRPTNAGNGNDDDQPSSAHARRLREMEASTSASSSRRQQQLPTAAEVSARLRGKPRSAENGNDLPSTSFRSPDAAARDDEKSKKQHQSNPAPRDWRDALEAAKMLEPGGDALTDTFG